jgi:hypothetical protein
MPTKTLPPEIELLLDCSRTDPDPERAIRTQMLVEGGTDWNFLLRMAQAHLVMPLLYRQLRIACPDLVPRNTLRLLHDHYKANARRNLYLTGELARILHAMDGNGIVAIPFKGPTLTSLAYGDLSLREFKDLDVLVQRKHVSKAREIMGCLGYHLENRLFDVEKEAYLHSRYELPFVRRDGNVLVELAWEILPKYLSFPVADMAIWENLHEPEEHDNGFRTLRAEDTLLLVCVHGAKHIWHRLAWICDVAELVRNHQGLEWQTLMEQAKSLGGLRMLFLGLLLAEELLGAGVPEEVLDKAKADSVVRRFTEELKLRFIQGPQQPPGLLSSSLFQVRMRERTKDRMKFWLGLAMTTTPEDRTTLPLVGSLLPIHRLLRPIRLVAKYIFGPLMRIRPGIQKSK